nr:unnamed protein product [Spirometra erinaceieuropaei]
MNLFTAACVNFGTAINTEKVVVMHQPPPGTAYVALQINVNGAQLQVVDNFTYLSSTLSRTIKIDDEVARRISKASQAFGRLQNSLESPRSPPQQQTESKDTLKTSLKRLQINLASWEDLARGRPTWRRTVKTGAAVYEAKRITAAKAKRGDCKSQLSPPLIAKSQPPRPAHAGSGRSGGVEWGTNMRARPCHPPARSPVSGLLNSLLLPGPCRGGEERVRWMLCKPTFTIK